MKYSNKKHHFFLWFIAALIISLALYIGCGNPTGGGGGGSGGITVYTLGIAVTPEGWGTVEVSPTGEVTAQGTREYLSGIVVTVTAEALGAHVFDHWGGALSSSTSITETITMDADKNIIASFQHVYYALEASVSPEGSGTVEPWGGIYVDSTDVLLTADANSGFIFDHWSVDLSGSDNPKSISMTANKSVTANFNHLYTLEVTVPTGGGTVEPFGGTYADGTNVTLLAVPDSGKSFGSWEGAGLTTTTSNPTTVEMSADRNINAYFKNPSWEVVGTAGFSAGTVVWTSLYINNGVPYVAYTDFANSNKATVMKYEGSSWQTIGSAGFTAGSAYCTSLYIYGGVPYVAFVDIANSAKATVMKYDGSWQAVGGAGLSAGWIDHPSLKMDNGVPYLAYEDGGNSSKATVMSFEANSATWVAVGSAAFSSGTANYTSLYIYNGVPYVAFQDGANSSKATVMKYESGSWQNVGSAGFSLGSATWISLYVYNGVPYVAFQDGGRSNKATVMKYDSSWQNVGSPAFSAGQADHVKLYVYNGVPYVAYKDGGSSNKATVMKYDGSWQAVGSAGFSAGGTDYNSFFIYGGIPYVSYEDAANSNKATVMKYD